MVEGWKFNREERGKPGIELPSSLRVERTSEKHSLSGMSRPMGGKETPKRDLGGPRPDTDRAESFQDSGVALDK